MASKARTKTRENSTGSLLMMTARYIGSCLCGAMIEPGDKIQYDTLNHKALCCECGRKHAESGASALPAVLAPTECQQIMDLYKDLLVQLASARRRKGPGTKALDPEICGPDTLGIERRGSEVQGPETQGSEARDPVDICIQMRELMLRLVQEFSAHSEVRQFITSLADCSDPEPDFVAIRAKYTGSCTHCGTAISPGRLCLYDRNGRRLHCIACDCLKTIGGLALAQSEFSLSGSPPLPSAIS